MGPGRRSGPSAPQDLIGVNTAAAFPTTRHWRLDCPPSLSPLLQHRLDDIFELSDSLSQTPRGAYGFMPRGYGSSRACFGQPGELVHSVHPNEVPGMPPVFGAGSTSWRGAREQILRKQILRKQILLMTIVMRCCFVSDCAR